MIEMLFVTDKEGRIIVDSFPAGEPSTDSHCDFTRPANSPDPSTGFHCRSQGPPSNPRTHD